mmetsp:Transcript_14278/g.42807  ORF Transcript_14278/g.42807 Transcript_14278/m.42807 type:complete len:223 (-) Transcript_14278:1038-1706(-)
MLAAAAAAPAAGGLGLRRRLSGCLRRSAVRMMPEGPEVQSLVDRMQATLGGGRYEVKRAEIPSGRYAAAPPQGWEDLTAQLPWVLDGVAAHGKFIHMGLHREGEGGEVVKAQIWSTLGLTGGWTLKPGHRQERIVLELAPLGADAAAARDLYLVFYDQRNFGTFKATFDEGELEAKLQSLGDPWLLGVGAGVEVGLEVGMKVGAGGGTEVRTKQTLAMIPLR